MSDYVIFHYFERVAATATGPELVSRCAGQASTADQPGLHFKQVRETPHLTYTKGNQHNISLSLAFMHPIKYNLPS